ncbi:MAG: hypothetical protein RBS50_16855 [Phenylobacterium sp.]|jgi:hypothetical protein|uniref:hypothetical protein n=1 Tax=Phenylobacterium sp. TaxID=1871053 RepID=UPI002A35E1C0|nr:hypothetical protein [Phenylobacterium sp.]MDX9999624.1 hypothetical protein [Phenylobacterium sp.]
MIGRVGAVVAAGILAVVASSAHGQSRPPIPSVVLAHMQSLDTRCLAAGGRDGTGRYVIAQDFTGDGRLDYLVSEGDYDCRGRPGLFRNNGLARVDIFVTGPSNQARRVYSEELLAYRVLAGRPAKVQIARRGAACGPGVGPQGQCAAQLEWNGQGFGEGVSVARAAPGAEAVVSRPGARSAQPAAPEPTALPAAPPPAAGGKSEFVVRCRRELVALDASAASWAQQVCDDRWNQVVASLPAADLLLAVTGGPAATLADVRARGAAVRWAARPEAKQLASGKLGGLNVAVVGTARPEAVEVGWGEIGADIPYDVAEALRQRGAKVDQVSCRKMGVGEGERLFAVTPPGRPTFALTVFQRTAPTGGAYSFYSASANLTGKPAVRGPMIDCNDF